MKLYRFFLYFLIALSCVSCSVDPTDYNEYLDESVRLKSFDLNVYEMKADFFGSKYSGIRDADIVSEKIIRSVKNGKIVNVTYNYGLTQLNKNYYVDLSGNTVKLKESGVLKANGYPSVDSFTRDITENGVIIFDFVSICLVIMFIIGLLLWFFVG